MDAANRRGPGTGQCAGAGGARLRGGRGCGAARVAKRCGRRAMAFISGRCLLGRWRRCPLRSHRRGITQPQRGSTNLIGSPLRKLIRELVDSLTRNTQRPSQLRHRAENINCLLLVHSRQL